jgi:NTE family protein
MEEFGLRDKIDAIYGVSAGAIIGTYWASGYSAQEIFDRLIATKIFSLKTFNFKLGKSLLSHEFLKERFVEDLPKTFSGLQKKMFIGAVDSRKAKFHLFENDDLITPLLASMSIPGVFPPVDYKDLCLVDGGILNNFPVDLAKKDYPHHKLI